MPSADEVKALIGPYPRPDDKRIAATRERVKVEGGYVDPIDAPHRSDPIDYESDPSGLKDLRNQREATRLLHGGTCACGRRGAAVGLEYETPENQIDTLRACIHCDGVHNMPRFRPPHL